MSINVHGRCVRLADGLALVGFGGAVPAYRDGTVCWPGAPPGARPDAAMCAPTRPAHTARRAGFPYTEEETAGHLDRLLHALPPAADDHSLDYAPPEEDSVLLMTHCGPHGLGAAPRAAVEGGRFRRVTPHV